MVFLNRIKQRVFDETDKRLNKADIQSICRLILILFAVIASASFLMQQQGRTIFGPQLGADFAAFYIAGKIYNDVSPDRIYDRELERELYHQIAPNQASGTELPYLNAPFFVLPFTVLARLPYSLAYLSWFLISLMLMLTGFNTVWRTLRSMPAENYSVAILLAVSFMPFMVECLAGGQTSAAGFACLAFAIYFERRGLPIASGVALALCSYKPTLLLLICPMLVVTRRFSTILGLTAGTLGLALLSVVAVGWKACKEYFRTLLFFTQASVDSVSVFRNWKYVDINSFFRSLLNEEAGLRWWMTALVMIPVAGLLIAIWRKAGQNNVHNRAIVWAVTITWSMVLNIYLGIYDTTFMILSVLLMTDVMGNHGGNNRLLLPGSFKLMVVILYVVPWITQPIAQISGFQLYTLILFAIGIHQMRLLTANCATL